MMFRVKKLLIKHAAELPRLVYLNGETMLFLDECGYTGEDLFNKDQPIFTLASINISEEKCGELKNKFFKNVTSQELKHSQLVRRPNQQKMILNFIRELSKNPQKIKLSISDKKYILITKMVDWIIEPPMYENGVDLYVDGGNIALSNSIYYSFKLIGGNDFFNSVLERFQILMRNRTLKSYHKFFSLFHGNLPKEVDEIAVYFRYWYKYETFDFFKKIPENDLNISFTNTLNMMATWSKELKSNVTLIHDRSSNMSKYSELWDLIMSPSNDAIKVGYDIRTIDFPLKIKRTRFEDSKNWAGLQLADILAGAVNYVFKKQVENEMDDYAKEVFDLIKNGFGYHLIVPNSAVTPEELGTIGKKFMDPNNYLGKIVSKYYQTRNKYT